MVLLLYPKRVEAAMQFNSFGPWAGVPVRKFVPGSWVTDFWLLSQFDPKSIIGI
jgi:hypothetical protein